MATNKLMEAAAEVLATRKQPVPAEPMHKVDAEVTDLGGPKQDLDDNKPGGDIYGKYKVDTAKATSGFKMIHSPTTKPSAASADPEAGKKLVGEEEESDEEETIDEASDMHKDEKHNDEKKKVKDEAYHMMTKAPANKYAMNKEEMKKKMQEDIDALFADDSTISEDFKSKVSTIFEARVNDRVSQIQEEIEANYADMLEEAITSVRKDLTEKVDDYLSYVVDQWMGDNEIAIESGLRTELTDDFIAGLRNLFAEHYISVPDEKVDLVDELAGKVEELESKLNEEIERGISFAKALVESRKNEVTREVSEGLTSTQVEKIKSLAESVEFSTEDEYKSKLETIRENYFPSGVKKADESQLNEIVEDTEGEKKVINDPFVAAVSDAISKTKF